MTGDELEFIKAITIFSGLVKFDLTDEICWFYLESLRPHGLVSARQALMKLARGAKVGRGIPSVDELLEIVAPKEVAKVTDEDEAAIAAERVIGAVARYGSAFMSTGWERQREFIGEIGWAVVEGNGGWRQFCDQLTNDQIPTVKAQIRRECQALIARRRAGRPDAPCLPGGPRPRALAAAPQDGNLAIPGPAGEAVKALSQTLTMDRQSKAAGERDPW